MAQEPKQNANADSTIYVAYQGAIKKDSLVEKEKFLEGILVDGANRERVVRAFKDDVKSDFQNSEETGKPIVIKGTMKGGYKSIAVYSTEPDQIRNARVTRVTHSAPGKMVAVNGFMIVPVTKNDGTKTDLGMPFRAFGDAAEGLAGLKVGDHIQGDSFQAREQNDRAAPDAPANVKYPRVIHFIGNTGIVDPSKTVENDTPTAPAANTVDESAFPEDRGYNPSDYDDEIPF